MSLRIGVDTGGTFTDVCAFDEETRRVHVRKVSSTPDDPGRAIVQGVTEILDQIGGRTIDEVGYFAHGTTVGTNALLTGRGARTGLITTRGFRDLLELGRGRRPSMYDPQADKPSPQVPRHLRMEVTERVRHTGKVETPLDEQDVRRAVRELRDAGVESIAVCLLYSYLNDAHERRIGEIVREELPDAYVSLSCDVLPEFREYERLSTVVTNSYVGPVVANYLARLRGVLADRGLTAVPHVTQSNGGVIPFSTAESLPVRLVLSGPSTGVVGAAQICSAAGFDDIITFDMGGTSSDISLVQEGRPKVTAGMELDGRPVRSPMLDIHTVGAGGGSLAWIDSGNHLRVGPQSAGAFPGPACYGNGDDAAVTDANVVLRMLNPEYLLNGQMKIDRSASVAAVQRLAEPLGLSVEETALGILRVVTANMARAIRVVSVQRGYDPRAYALVPFGGAGPLHASRLARELGMRTIVIPEIPGAQSALGLLMTDVKTDFMRTLITAVDAGTATDLDQVFGELATRAADWFVEEEVAEGGRTLTRRMDLRYRGQNFELAVEIPDGHSFAADGVDAVVELFHEAHERVYGYRSEEAAVEVVTFRLEAAGSAAHVDVQRDELSPSDPSTAVVATRSTCFDPAVGYVDTPVYDRSKLTPGDVITGPAIVEQMDTTTVLLPSDTCRVDAYRNLVVEIGEQE
ncbi:hydantoinase/oxoprolinase family protein [Agromyces aerolatus]|uniref:hydantoinase/oxoprolinase family protein n=1 Tax=Agromyces sp. LY-1074 TaxID=3074080 RepID=UPI00285611CE|nr:MULTISPECIES: hydantoinase/oxoprolinase family protein [unclassified Agromyces]MDR5698769.1 hydantoinase/oxoprolinase family protein [Agromyces sp. LY-1074]MDR5705063.1 hydantoinase/oxoprolinase family protein [Agromyces sp. LY-1358]